MDSEINDIRNPADFKGYTFSKYKRSDARKQLLENMKKGKLEPACYWSAELICAGHFMEVWETVLHYVGKHIHLGSPKVVVYLEKRYDAFRQLMEQGTYVNELQQRNNPLIRKLFAEIVSILTLSNKKNSFEPVSINRVEEFDITQMTERLKAPHMDYAASIFLKGDPKELFIAINEFAYQVSPDKRSMLGACYWIEWVIEFDAICKKRKEACLCVKRDSVPVENKYRRDIIWILWDTLFHYAETNNDQIIPYLRAIYNLFCIKYTTAACKKRRYLLYFAVALLTEPVEQSFAVELLTDKTKIQNVVENIGQVYKQIKKKEESPNTDYLYANMDKQNTLDKSMRRLEMVNSLDSTMLHKVPDV